MDQDVDLAPGERLLWEGRPDPDRHFTLADAFLVPFYALFLGFSIFWTAMALRGSAPYFFPIFGSLFIVIGLYACFGRFVVKWFSKLRTRYVVTDRRAIIRSPWSTREVRLSSAHVETKTTGKGRHVTVIFSNPTLPPRVGFSFGRTWSQEQLRNTGMDLFAGGLTPAFYDVADVDGLRRALEPALGLSAPQTPRPYGS